jgi:plastocyanin
MNSLDSRQLRLGDTFAQRFLTPGIYRYAVGVRGAFDDEQHARFVINVAEEAGVPEPKTENVTVLFANSTFGVDREQVQIYRGDVVMWSTTASTAPGFAVFGRSENTRFDSSEIGANAMYSHAFGTIGEIEWVDAHEGELRGTVIIQDHRCHTSDERAAYLETLRKPTLVMIDEGRARPNRVSIVIGQTVFFAVRGGACISIVDRRLLDAASAFLNPQPLPP